VRNWALGEIRKAVFCDRRASAECDAVALEAFSFSFRCGFDSFVARFSLVALVAFFFPFRALIVVSLSSS
jgi:hypothetical protein